jgi:hypothetical protein
MLLLLCFSLLPLLPNFIVITDDCAVAALSLCPIFIVIPATVALFLLSSLTLRLFLPLFDTVFISIVGLCCRDFPLP